MSAITPRASGTSTDGSSCALDVRERPLIEISGKAARGTSIWHAHSDPARANSMGGDIDFLQLLSAQPEVGARLRSDQLVLIDIALQIGRQGSTVLRDRVSSSRPRTVRARRCHATRIAAQESKPLAHQNDLVLCAVARDRTVTPTLPCPANRRRLQRLHPEGHCRPLAAFPFARGSLANGIDHSRRPPGERQPPSRPSALPSLARRARVDHRRADEVLLRRSRCSCSPISVPPSTLLRVILAVARP